MDISNNNAFFRQLLFIVSIVALGLIIFYQLNFFTGAVLGACTIYCALRNPYFYFVNKRNWKPWQASSLLVLLSATLLLTVGYFIFRIVASEIPSFDTEALFSGISELAHNLNARFKFQIISPEIASKSGSFIMKIASMFLNTTYNVAFNLFMMMFLLYFMFANASQMEKTFTDYSPFNGKSMQLIKTEVKSMITTNAIGLPLILFLQTIFTTLGFWAIGIKDPALWGLMTAIFGLVPVVGTAVIWVPMSIYLITNGQTWMGIGVALYVALVIGNIDNLVRLFLMRKLSNTHPLVTILGISLGVPLFGFWGIIFGPILISGFLLLIRIYYEEYGILNKDA